MRTTTEALMRRARAVIPGGVNSPVRAFGGLGLTPMIVASGSGALICDVDEREYIDYCGGWGSLICGHAHPDVLRAASQQLARGSSFGIASQSEIRLAEAIVSHIDSLEKIRFVSSGTEATMTALRIARAATGRPKIVKFTGHYHGHSDGLLMQAGSGVFGLPQATSLGLAPGAASGTICLPFNDVRALHKLFTAPEAREIAAVILEPIAANMGVVPPLPGFLEELRKITRCAGALLIFDEVITGFRVGLQGAQGLYDIDPDLSCFGKIIGGGFPAAAVGGKAKFMDLLAPLGGVYQAGTLSGSPVAMEAGLATLRLLERPGVYELLEQKTARLCTPIERALHETGLGTLQRVGSMLTLFFGVDNPTSKEALHTLDTVRFARLFRALFEQGIYLPPAAQEAWFVSLAHTNEQLDRTAEAVCNFIRYDAEAFPPSRHEAAAPLGATLR